MNIHGVLTVEDEKIDAGLREYHWLKEEGEYIAILKNRAWLKLKNPCLGCYFESEDGTKFYLHAWRTPLAKGEHYCPRNSDVWFETTNDETKWRLTLKTSKNGNVFWATAEEILD